LECSLDTPEDHLLENANGPLLLSGNGLHIDGSRRVGSRMPHLCLNILESGCHLS